MRKAMKMEDPIFGAGSIHTATAALSLSPADLSCTAELWLSKDGVSKDASASASFTSTGASQNVQFSVTMPAGGFSYRVLLDISADGYLIGSFEATESVLIPTVTPPEIVWD